MVRLFDRWLARLSADPVERRNVFWTVACNIVGSAGGVFLGGPVLQAFLVDAGLGEGQIGLHGAVGSAAGALGLLLLMGLADRVRRRVRAVVLCSLIACLEPIALLCLAMLDEPFRSPALVLAALVAVTALLQPVGSLQSMVHAGLAVRVIHQRIRGRVSGLSGAAAGATAMALGLVVARVLTVTEAGRGFVLCFAVAAALLAVSALMWDRLVELPELARPQRPGGGPVPWVALREIFRLPQFRDLLVPNLLRGLVSSVLFFAWIVGLKRLDLPVAYTGLAAAVQAVSGSIVGSAVIGLFSDRCGPGLVILAGSLLCGGCLVAMVLTGSPALFLAVYGLLILGSYLVGAGVPLGTYEIVPPELMGAYSGSRLMVMSAAGAVSMPLVGLLLQTSGPLPVFVGAAALSGLMGLGYWRGFRRHPRIEPQLRPPSIPA